jgi:hypothetical protein
VPSQAGGPPGANSAEMPTSVQALQPARWMSLYPSQMRNERKQGLDYEEGSPCVGHLPSTTRASSSP